MPQRELGPQDYVAMLRRRWLLIVGLTIIGPPLAYGVSRLLPPRYKSQTLVLVSEPTVSSDLVKPVDTSDMSQRLASMQQQILSRSRLEPIITKFGLFPKDAATKPMEDLVAKLQKAIEVTPIQPMADTHANNLPGFYVNVTLDSPQTAQQVCTTITSMFIDENVRSRRGHTEGTTDFLAQQLTEAKTKLDEQDAKLAAFKTHNFGSLPDQQKNNLDLLTGLTSQLDAATQALARAQQDKSFAESMLSQQLSTWEASLNGGTAETPEQQLAPLQAELQRLQGRYTDDHPDVVKTKAAIAALKKKIADSQNPKVADSEKIVKPNVEPTQIAQLRAQIHTYESVIAERTKEQDQIKQQIKVMQDRVQSSPIIEQQFKELTRDYQTALDFYNDLLKKRDESAMASDLERRQEGDEFRVLDAPNLPDKPSFPNRLFFALGGFAGGLGLGVGLAYVLEMQDTSFRSEADVENILQLPVLAMIPAVKPMAAKPLKVSVKAPPPNRNVSVGARS
jgi:polysaccharide chain length determinant protein (PEP-CTERM system associated)